MPMAGKKPMPKIISGSKMMLATQPHIMLNMDIFMFPMDWNIFSKDNPMVMTGENRKALEEYANAS